MSFTRLEKTTQKEEKVSCRGCKKALIFYYPVEHVYHSDEGGVVEEEDRDKGKISGGKFILKKLTIEDDHYFHDDFVFICNKCCFSKVPAILLKVKKELTERVILEHIRDRTNLIKAHYIEFELLKKDLFSLEQNFLKNKIKGVRPFRWHFMPSSINSKT